MSFSKRVRAKGGCALAHLGGCEGEIEAHHLIPKQRIKHLPRAMFDPKQKRAMIRDDRNGIPLCHKHHHQVTVRFIYLPPEAVPPETHEFAIEHRLEWALEAEVPGLKVQAPRGASVRPMTNERSGRSSRRKGKTAELEVVHKFHEYGFTDVRRTGDTGQADGDLENTPDYTEVRRREKLNIPAWVRECREESGDREWVLIARRSREDWVAVVELDRYLELLRLEQQVKEYRNFFAAHGNREPHE